MVVHANWEAQARTNSILAGSLKALEERLDDCAVLLDWRHEVEQRFEDMQKELAEARQKHDEYVEKQERKANAGKKWGKTVGGVFAAAASASASSAVVPVDAKGEAEAEELKPSRLQIAKEYFVSGRLRKPCIIVELALQVIFGFGLLVQMSASNDVSQQAVAGLFGITVTASGFLALHGMTYRGRNVINAYLLLQIWAVALGAVFMHMSILDVVKNDAFCDLPIEGLPTGECTQRQNAAEANCTFAFGALFVSLTVGCILMSFRDEAMMSKLLSQSKGGAPSMAQKLAALAGGGSSKPTKGEERSNWNNTTSTSASSRKALLNTVI
mmetsp:Transcript_11554/g.37976  ORF Transcript_11554/g.37976 Transcript_11554/m.37976 type:complete len:327 (-) Transcript_11554:1325-2305(-)